MKKTLLLLACAAAFTSRAQLRPPATFNSFKQDIQKVVAAYPHGFTAITGDVVEQGPQTISYASLVVPKGAQESTVTRYSAELKKIYSWQAVMLTTEDFEDAVTKYKSLYVQLKGMNVQYVADDYTLGGSYEAPAEARKFTSSTLYLIRPPEALKKLRIEVTMQFQFPDWKVGIVVYDKEKEDDENAAVMDQ